MAYIKTSGAPSNAAELTGLVNGSIGILTGILGGAGGINQVIAALKGAQQQANSLNLSGLTTLVNAIGLLVDLYQNYQIYMSAQQGVSAAAANYENTVFEYLKRLNAYIDANKCPPSPNPPPPPSDPIPVGMFISHRLGSHDPNEIIGPAGVGSAQFVPENAVLPYTIGFERTPQPQRLPLKPSSSPSISTRVSTPPRFSLARSASARSTSRFLRD